MKINERISSKGNPETYINIIDENSKSDDIFCILMKVSVKDNALKTTYSI